MDRDRLVVDGRDLLESELQDLIREAFEAGWEFGDCNLPDPAICCYAEQVQIYGELNKKLHELLISYLDGETGDVGTQDETSEAREVGDSVRPKSHLIPSDPNAFVVDEWDPIKKITDEFAREMKLRFAYEGKRVAIGHCDLTKDPDGSIHGRIEYYPQDKKPDDEDTDEYEWIREEDVPEG